PIAIPAGVKVKITDGKVLVEGPKGTKLEQAYHRAVKVEIGKLSKKDDETVFTPDAAGNVISVTRKGEDRVSWSIHGLMRPLINNMVQGVTQGYEKKLKMGGVGYGAKMDKTAVVLSVGFANQIRLEPPASVSAECPDANTVIVKGADKQKVG